MFRPLWKSVWRFLKKVRLDLHMIHFHHLNPKESKGAYQTDTFMNMFFVVLLTIAKIWNYHRCPTLDEWVEKIWYTYTMAIYLEKIGTKL
jgi:hypothetical protein